ncbi:MAG: TauD/TfdA family dioxygenase [Gammaproteobacteria bacterium]|nr:TauD/TfdA family dioxygenase [Gammaproteobacteria bacterium]
MTTRLVVEPLAGSFAARVSGMNDGALDEISPADVEMLHELWVNAAVLCFAEANLTSAGLVRLASMFGEVRPQPLQRDEYKVPGYPQLRVVSSAHLDTFGDGLPLRTGGSWHTDHSQLSHPPSGTILSAVQIPGEGGGDTSFTDQRGAYDGLPVDVREDIEWLVGEHVYNSRYAVRRLQKLKPGEVPERAPSMHPLVRRHPITGRKLLYFNPIRIERFVGLDDDTSQAILGNLLAHCSQEKYVYRHRWSPGDVLLWDNRQTMHMVDHDYVSDTERIMHRALVYTGTEWGLT